MAAQLHCGLIKRGVKALLCLGLAFLPACRLGISGSEKIIGKLETPQGASFDAGTQYVGGSAALAVTITNKRKGTAREIVANISGDAFVFDGGSYPGNGGTCGASIDGGASCELRLLFQPTRNGEHEDSLTLSYFDGEESVTLVTELNGFALSAAQLEFAAAPAYEFADTVVAQQTLASLVVTNSGDVAATGMAEGATALSAPLTFNGGSYPGDGGTCGAVLEAHQTCELRLKFAPVSVVTSSATVIVAYHNGVGEATSSLSVVGDGILSALLISDGPTFDFGTQFAGTTTYKTFTVTNGGALHATAVGEATPAIAAPWVYRGGTYPGTGGTCTTSLSAGASCLLVVGFSPIAAGTFNDTIAITYFDGLDTLTASRAITGVGVTAAVLAISDGPTYSFGQQFITTVTEKTFTVINSAQTDATSLGVGSPAPASPYAFKGGAYPGTGGTCSTTLSAGASCTFVITYTPTSGGFFGDTVRLTYHDGFVTRTASVAVTASTSSNAALVYAQTPLYDFSNQYVGTSTDVSLTVTNGGGTSATSLAAGTPALLAPFSFKGGTFPGTGGTCTSTLTSASSCLVVLTFSPSVVTTSNDTLRLSYHNGSSTQDASLPITGTGGVAVLAISDGPTYNFGGIALGAVATKAFTVSNSGPVTALTMALGSPALTAPFAIAGGVYPGTGGTCGATLAALASCAVVVEYTPTSFTADSSTLRLDYNNGQTSQTATRVIAGTGVTEAQLSITETDAFNFGSVTNTTVGSHSFTIANSGQATATEIAESSGALSAPYSYLGGTFPGTGGTCTTSLTGASTCIVVVAFSPTVTGTFNDAIAISYHNGVSAGQSVQRTVTGVGVAPALLTISDATTFSFGNVYTGSSAQKVFTVSNDGEIAASAMAAGSPALGAPYSFLGGTYPGNGGTCGTGLAPSGTCTIVVNFSPVASSTVTDTVRLTYHNSIGTQTATRPITGTGVIALLVLSNSPALDFGPQLINSVTSTSISLVNSGTGAATLINEGTPALSAPFSFTGTGYPGTGGTCSTTLAAGANCTLSISFTPTVAGVASDVLRVSYFNGEVSTVASRTLQGTGVSAVLSISDGPTYDYGTAIVASMTDKTFTITNSGTGTALSMEEGTPLLTSPFDFKGGAYPGTGGTCVDTLGSGNSCTIVVTFAPVSVASSTGTLAIAYSDATTSVSTSIDLAGIGAAAASLSISDGATYDFGSQEAGLTLEKTFTVTNIGGVGATAIAAGTPGFGASYTFTGGSFPGSTGTCGTTLAVSDSCTVAVTFSPSAAGVLTDTLRIGYHNGLESTTGTRALTGTGIVPAVLAISNGPTFDYGTVASGATKDQTLMVVNTGSFAATAIGEGTPALAAPFSFKDGSFPGTGGTCTSTLAVSGTCSIVVRFSPTVAGVASDTVTLTYHNGATTRTASRPVTGTTPVSGSLDSTFSDDGVALASMGNGNDFGRAVALQSDGSIIVAGYTEIAGIDEFGLARFLPTGELDVTFGAGGRVRTAVGTLGDRAYAVAVQADGKIVLAGYSNRGSGDVDFAVVRYLTTGALDTTFSGDGMLTTSFSSREDRAHGLAVQSDGSLVVAGYAEQGAGIYAQAVARYTSSGALDSSFAGTGTTVLDIGEGVDDRAYAIALQSDGRILLAGHATISGGKDISLVRLTTSGALDTTFSGDGMSVSSIVSGDDQGFSLAVQTDGAIVVAGYYTAGASDSGIVVTRHTTAGALDSTFSGDGISTINPGSGDDRAHAVGLQANGNIVIAGYRDLGAGAFSFAISRFSATGALDTTFGTSGTAVAPFTSGVNKAYGLVLDSNSRWIAVGEAVGTSTQDFGIARFWP